MTTEDRFTFLRFVAVGLINTIVGFAIVIAAIEWLGANAFVANGAGLATGFVVGFLLNRAWTFRSDRTIAATAPRYLLAFALAYSINLGLLALALRAGLHPWLAQGVALATYSVAFYCLCRFSVFRAEGS